MSAWDSGERRPPQPDRAAGPDRGEKSRKRCFGRSENRDPVEHVLAIKFGDIARSRPPLWYDSWEGA
jgi:hypothetical protein